MLKNDRVYYARILISLGIYEVCDLIVRTIGNVWFVGIESKYDKHAYLFNNRSINKTIFTNRKDTLALDIVLEAEKRKPKLIFTKIEEE